MNRLRKEDLAQMNRDYFQSLDKQKLVEVAGNLHQLAVEQLEKLESGIEVKCTLHLYYQAICACGHHTKEKPLVGYVSLVEGRSRDLSLQEYGLVGPMLATFIASLGIRYRMSRPKIRELLNDWVGVLLSVGTIDKCIREVGIACSP